MIRGRSVRLLLESVGPQEFPEAFRSMLISEDDRGNPTTKGAGSHPNEFSIRELAESLVGVEWVHDLARGDYDSTIKMKQLALREATGAMTPSQFSNINAFNASVAGLVEATILEGYQRAEFIGDRFVRTVPTRVNGGKALQTGHIGDVAKPVIAGEEFPSVSLPSSTVSLPELLKHGLKCALTRETVVFSLDENLLKEAGDIGWALRYKKEIRISDAVQGITNTYNRNGVSYATFLKTGAFVNSRQGTLTSQQDIDAANLLLQSQVDPDTGVELGISAAPVLLVSPFQNFTARALARATTLEFLPGGGANGTMRYFTENINPPFEVVSSMIWYNRLLKAGVSAVNAQGRWLYGDPPSGFQYREAWPITVRQADPSSAELVTKDILNLWAASEFGQVATIEPRYVIQNTVEA
jgi:hypothetical protein